MVSSVFDSRCCYNKWAASLYGRLCFLSDDVNTLKSIVYAGDKQWVVPTSHYMGLEDDCD